MPLASWYEQEHKQSHSVELQRAKDGAYYWSLKLYFAADEINGVGLRLNDLDSELRARFLPPPGKE